jgi:hypothetical protein
MIVVIYLLACTVAISVFTALRGCKVYKDGWFIPILVAQLWVAILALNRGDYNS